MADFYSEILQQLKKKELSLEELAKLKRELARKYQLPKIPTNIEILLQLPEKEMVKMKRKLLTKPGRTSSGVAPLAIMSKPFPCPHGKCAMCPGGPESFFGEVPQSYTGHEPASMRGRRNHYDAYLQVFNRLEQYFLLGHNFEKIELIIMGGTFPSFPKEYQEKFITEALQALNDFSQLFYDESGELDFLKFKKFFQLPAENLLAPQRIKEVQKKLEQLKKKRKTSLEEEQKKNETAKIRCVAMCLETRPDYASLQEGNECLRLGATRIELGMQSVYDDILKKICRGHSTTETKIAFRTLKDLGFKVGGHYMPGLPEVTRKKDLAGMKKLFSDPDYRPDALKIYPCMVLPGTKLEQEYLAGRFQPLDTEEATEMIVNFKKIVPEYCRIMRVQRDIPTTKIIAGVDKTNLRQYMEQNYKFKCHCIRCREAKGQEINWSKVKINIEKYVASKGQEFFISVVDTSQDLLVGFLRMRFPSQFLRPEITTKSALIRQLHVYGTATGLGQEGAIQHRGWGKKLLQTAEELAKKKGKNKLVVISGIGVREYYKKLGYVREGVYMVKEI